MKLFNIRVPVLLDCMLIFGIVIGYFCAFYALSIILITAVIPLSAVIFIITAIRSKKNYPLVLIVLCTVLFICGGLNCFFRIDGFSDSKLTDGETYNISATVTDKGEYYDNEYLILSNVTADGTRINGKMYARLYGKYGDFCDVGYKVTFKTAISINDAFTYGKLNYRAEQNIKYSCTVYGGLKADYGFSLFGSIRSGIRNTLYDNLDYETASIVFAMLTGNTQNIDGQTMAGFRYGGIAHIFAVSGLHIGIVYGVIYFIMNKFRLNKYAFAVICLLPVFFYAGICGFTLSSLRAAIMCAVNSLTRLIHKKYDGLNSLAAAVLIILTATPLSLFSAGFQLSVCAVAGIFMLSKKIARRLKKLPEKVSGTISVSLSAQAGTLPAMLANFGYISGAGLILNIVVVPLLSVIYVILLLSTFISVILPFAAHIILPYAALPLEAVVSVFVSSGFERALISGFGTAILIPFYIILILLLSDKLNLKFIYRIAALICSLAVACGCILINIYSPFNGYKIIASAYYGGGQVAIKSNKGNVLIITEGLNTSHIQALLNDNGITALKAVIILGGEDCVYAFDTNINCDTLYVYGDYLNIQPYGKTTVYYESNFSVIDAEFEFADGYSLLVHCGGATIGICVGKLLPFDKCDLLLTDNLCAGYADYTAAFNVRGNEYCLYDCGDMTFYAADGKLKPKRL